MVESRAECDHVESLNELVGVVLFCSLDNSFGAVFVDVLFNFSDPTDFIPSTNFQEICKYTITYNARLICDFLLDFLSIIL